MVFQSTRPVRGATEAFTGTFHQPNDFNPRAPCGARHVGTVAVKTSAEFQSTRPVRGATKDNLLAETAELISIHAPRAGRDHIHIGLNAGQKISIHAPRAGRDVVAYNAVYFSLSISIHAPRAGRDGRRRRIKPAAAHFNPRAPCGARRCDVCGGQTCCLISIHAPRAGRD